MEDQLKNIDSFFFDGKSEELFRVSDEDVM